MASMTDTHTEMQILYDRTNSLWARAGLSRPITADDVSKGLPAEAIRWARDKLGGRDQDLVGPKRWEQASLGGWSEQATFSCLPHWVAGETWSRYVHSVSHYVHRLGSGDDDDHSPGHARLELELSELVVGWLADEARGIKRTFPPLVLPRPPHMKA
jgi:hypothetical protein